MLPQFGNKVGAIAFALFASARSAETASSGGFLPVGLGNGTDPMNPAISAGRHPNATNSISFDQVYNGKNETWHWRVNITELDVPNDLNNYGENSANYSEGNRVANTQFELQWPDSTNETFNGFLEERNLTIYFNAFQLFGLNNVTSKYDKSDNGDCSAILGNKCTQALMNATLKAGDGSFDQSSLEGCESTFKVGYGFGSGFDLNPSVTVDRGDTLYYTTSNVFPSTNETVLNMTESSLQMLAMTFTYGKDSPQYEHGPVSAAVLCQVVDKDAATSAASGRWEVSLGMLLITLACALVVT